MSAEKVPSGRRTAYHEAGHAVAAMILNLPFDLVTIIPTEDYAGALHLTPFSDGTYVDGTDVATQWLVRAHAICRFAGGAAADRLGGEEQQVGCDEDHRQAVDWLDRVSAGALQDNWGHYQSQSEAMIERAWPAVEALAMALLERHQMTSAEAIPIIKAHLPQPCPVAMQRLEMVVAHLQHDLHELRMDMNHAKSMAYVPFRWYDGMTGKPVAEINEQGELVKPDASIPPLQLEECLTVEGLCPKSPCLSASAQKVGRLPEKSGGRI